MELPEKNIEKTPWAGYIISGLPVVFLLVDGVMKLLKPEPVVTATIALGYSESIIVPLGILLMVCTVLYAVPKTSVLGAILLTGYLGGAVASHVRLGDPLFTHILVPVYIGILLWLGLFLRYPTLRKLVPIKE